MGYVILTRTSGKFSGPCVKMTYPPDTLAKTRNKNFVKFFDENSKLKFH